MKYSLDDIHEALKRVEVPADKIDATAQVLQEMAEENRPDPADRAKRAKKEIVGFVAKVPSVSDQTEQQVWLVQANKGIDHTAILPILQEAGKIYNESIVGKKKKAKIVTTADHFALIKPKLLREKGIKVLTKEPIILVGFDN